jgi:hypothetical protein
VAGVVRQLLQTACTRHIEPSTGVRRTAINQISKRPAARSDAFRTLREHGGALTAQIAKLLRGPPHRAMERQLADQRLCRLLKTAAIVLHESKIPTPRERPPSVPAAASDQQRSGVGWGGVTTVTAANCSYATMKR